MAHDLVQYINSSIFVVNEFNPDQTYRILLAVDDSPGTKKAIKYGVRIAQAFNIGVDIMTVSTTDHFGDDYRNAAEWAAKLLRRSGIEYQNSFQKGNPSEIITQAAGDDHIIVMGSSTRSPLKKFFKGSKPLKVLKHCQCPTLIVQ